MPLIRIKEATLQRLNQLAEGDLKKPTMNQLIDHALNLADNKPKRPRPKDRS